MPQIKPIFWLMFIILIPLVMALTSIILSFSNLCMIKNNTNDILPPQPFLFF